MTRTTLTAALLGAGTALASCPPAFKNVVFNGGYSPSQFPLIQGASNYVTFDLGTNPGQIPMMAFASDVPAAVEMANSASPPEYMLTFNEPDYSYMGVTPTMTPQEAADAIRPLLDSPGSGATKFIAPVTADPTSSWLTDFYAACGCQDFFHAYNIHVYLPEAQQTIQKLTDFRGKFPDKPVWVTELAPGNANPACSLGWDAVEAYMEDVFAWAAGTGWVEKVFWNSGNRIRGDDTNVCNSYLLDEGNQPTPLLAAYTAVQC